LLLHDQHRGVEAVEERVPLVDRNFVEDVDDGDDVELAADALVEADDDDVPPVFEQFRHLQRGQFPAQHIIRSDVRDDLAPVGGDVGGEDGDARIVGLADGGLDVDRVGRAEEDRAHLLADEVLDLLPTDVRQDASSAVGRLQAG